MNNIGLNDLCSGCGVCSAICPKDCISVSENARGELRPGINEELCVSCGKCISVCPFREKDTDIAFETENVFVGVAPGFSENGSSGGVATYFIDSLLRNKIVDSAVLVRRQNDCDELFTYSVFQPPGELSDSQGSAYYPVTLQNVLKKIKSVDGKVAVIGVPCFITALKKLKNAEKIWDEKLKVLIGVVCGHTPNRHLVDCLAFSSGHRRSDITGCRFRIKSPDRPAWDYGVHLAFSDNTDFTSFGSGDFGFLFWRRLFIQKCCLNCRDVFAKDADAVFMDAWLPEHKEKSNGTSLIICRSAELQELFSPLIAGGYLSKASKDQIYIAQKNLVAYKSRAGKHISDQKTECKVQKIFSKNKGQKDIVERIKRLCYKESLKRKNPILWVLLEIKDRLRQ